MTLEWFEELQVEKVNMQLDNLDWSFTYLLESSAKMHENIYKLDSTTSAVFIGTDFITLILNVYFHYLIYRMTTRKHIKNSQGTTTNLLTCYCVIVPTTFMVAFTYLNIILQYTYPHLKFSASGFVLLMNILRMYQPYILHRSVSLLLWWNIGL